VTVSSAPPRSKGEIKARDFQRAMLNLLEDADEERRRLETVQRAMLNLVEDFAQERTRFAQVQTAMLNIFEDFSDERLRLGKMQTATLNILEDSETEKETLRQSQSAFLNILEDVELERERAADANQRLGAVNKELEDFAYAASHDLRAPLRVIDNASQWLEEDLAAHLSDMTRKSMELMRGRVRRMERLLDDLLEYSRIGRVADKRFAEAISGTTLMADIQVLLAAPEGFSISVDPQFADIIVPRMPLQHVLLNLVGNAVKHHDRKRGHIEVAVADRGADWEFSVKDDGPGIPPEFHDRIFQMFQTLKPRDQVEGSGMGLAMVRKYVEVAGGAITLDSAPGRGSVFRITWPKAYLAGGGDR
jgi:signal transduction histidine kinase